MMRLSHRDGYHSITIPFATVLQINELLVALRTLYTCGQCLTSTKEFSLRSLVPWENTAMEFCYHIEVVEVTIIVQMHFTLEVIAAN